MSQASTTTSLAAPPIPTATSTSCTSSQWLSTFNSTVKDAACAIGASSGSYQALQKCCGDTATIKTVDSNCGVYCEVKGLTLNAVNQCLFLNLGQMSPGYSGGIHCNKEGADFTSSVAPGPTSTGTSGAGRTSAISASGGNLWGQMFVGWALICLLAGGVAAV
ncbi:hypothetical protein BT63DRAFT_426559 [Microthyrium microscopicum]|uniref:Uncharacterized protein n=1 Tax=Microthyrium microscopicum TaxID=703497 RepID=A0A6A6U6Y4_9PEZI|nr:hypothetical protein BT63DRAFT_426559 [Microthyrium microscopicum]